MVSATISPAAWAAQTFGAAQLGDPRRTARLVASATAIAQRPTTSLPDQMADPAALKATYRLLGNDAIDAAAILAPHTAQTRQAASGGGVVLLVQDATELDFRTHHAVTGLGPIGNGRGQGMLLQTVLAVTAADRRPLGVLGIEAWTRPTTPTHPPARRERSVDRAKRDRESAIWGRLATQAGPPPAATTWVHVADRGGDCYGFFTAVHQVGADLLVRTGQDRRVVLPDGTSGRLVATLRALPPVATRPLTVSAHGAHPARETTVAVAWTPVTVQPPTNHRRDLPTPAPLPMWAVRVWEPQPPPDVAPVEWRLLTTVPVVTVADAWERVDWYTARWVIEELHKGRKSGCRIEQVRLQARASIERFLAVLLPVAVRLLQLRAVSRQQPYAPVDQVTDAATVQLVARLARQPPADTVARFAAQVARLGGYQDRRGDGSPGWQTLWRGWQKIEEAQTTMTRLGLTMPD